MITLKPIFDAITQTKVLWCLFLSTLIGTALFSYCASQFGITLLDGVSSSTQAQSIIESMSAEQRLAHVWITGTLDVLYPFIYGLFFAGVALRCFPRAGKVFSFPILLVIPTDLFEGLIQILALSGNSEMLVLKEIVTPLKFGLFAFGLAIAIFGALNWGVSKLRSR
jgi:hypothetical protein